MRIILLTLVFLLAGCSAAPHLTLIVGNECDEALIDYKSDQNTSAKGEGAAKLK